MVSVQQLAGWSSGTRPIGLSRVVLAVPKTCMIIYHVTGSCIMLHGHVLSYMVMCHCTCSCFSPHPCRVPFGGIHVGLPPCKRSCQKFCPVSPWSPQRNTRSHVSLYMVNVSLYMLMFQSSSVPSATRGPSIWHGDPRHARAFHMAQRTYSRSATRAWFSRWHGSHIVSRSARPVRGTSLYGMAHISWIRATRQPSIWHGSQKVDLRRAHGFPDGMAYI